MNIARIDEILQASFGDTKDPGVVLVTAVWTVPLNLAKAQENADEMAALLEDWPEAPAPQLGDRITYTEACKALEGQHRAIALFTFGALLSWWKVTDPYLMMGGSETAIEGYTPMRSLAPA